MSKLEVPQNEGSNSEELLQVSQYGGNIRLILSFVLQVGENRRTKKNGFTWKRI